MAKKKTHSVLEAIREAISDLADAASVAATGSQIGVLELAAEEEMGQNPVKKKRKARIVRKKRTGVKKSKRKTKKSRGVKRR